MSNDATITIWTSFGSAAAGALLGSLSAFYLGIRKQKNDKKENDHASLLRAHYALISQWNIIEGIRKDLLEPMRDDPNRFLKFPVYYAFAQPVRVPFSEISFIAQSDNPNLLQEIHISEQKFDSVVNAHKLLTSKIENFYSRSDVQEFNFETGHSRVNASSKDIYMIEKWTDNLYDLVDSALPKIKKDLELLTTFTKTKFKGMTALQLVSIESHQKEKKKDDFASDYSLRKWGRHFFEIF
jgi:hypothetical protein